jgi:hemerythrin-like domain-containing protein
MASRLDQLVSSPAAGLDEPFAMLHACHERIERTLALLSRLETHVAQHGADEQARQAARDVIRYFDVAAPQHHLDEERHVLPALRATGDPAHAALAARLEGDHRAMESAWAAARAVLQQVADGSFPRLEPGHGQALHSFTQLYAEHIAAEEGTAFPTAEARLDAAAVRAMSADMRARRGAS